MWNRRRNWWLWLKVRTSSRRGFGVPLLLPVLEETMEELYDFMSLWKPLLRRAKSPVAAVFNILQAALELIREVRQLGPCTLVDVRTEDVRVDIRLV